MGGNSVGLGATGIGIGVGIGVGVGGDGGVGMRLWLVRGDGSTLLLIKGEDDLTRVSKLGVRLWGGDEGIGEGLSRVSGTGKVGVGVGSRWVVDEFGVK